MHLKLDATRHLNKKKKKNASVERWRQHPRSMLRRRSSCRVFRTDLTEPGFFLTQFGSFFGDFPQSLLSALKNQNQNQNPLIS